MKPPAPPRLVSVAALVLAALLLSGVLFVRKALPASRLLNNPRLDELRRTESGLEPYGDSVAQGTHRKVEELRTRLWSEASFNRWRADKVPKGWIVQQLGDAGLKRLDGRRYAFQRPGATDAEWPEISAFLGALEEAPAASVQSATLAVQPGYLGSRKFSQCLFIATFYFHRGATATPGG